jgi:predicted acylesterase/phospholipase RssA
VVSRLSGGAYLGYYHVGVAKTLFSEGLLPRVISGASAGSLMAAAIGYVSTYSGQCYVLMSVDIVPIGRVAELEQMLNSTKYMKLILVDFATISSGL